MAKVVVTGGAGFIGSHIVDSLLASGHSIEVIDDLSSGNTENLPAGVTLHKLDIRSADTRALLAKIQPDILVHAAAQISVRVSMENPVFDTEVNVVGLVNLLHAFAGRRYPHFVLLSTGGAIYGDQDVFPAPENHPIRASSVYGTAKRVDEMYLDLWGRQYGMSWTALRLANVYGPRQNPHGEAGVVAIFAQRLLRKQQPTINGDGTQTRDFVFVGDVAAAVKAVTDKSVTGIYNIGTGRETNVNQLYSMIRGAVGSQTEATHAEAKAGEQMRSCIDAALASKTFGWKPSMPIEQGIKATVEWFRQHAA
ncbi:MAG: NAD-dependent epimerase/dehydratase family protein [Deltaproteobacteria bacterium]|nr:NAD-dependent epimerase/dehydratase family protein [Deltaproteobacteria bacterium]